MAEFGTEKNTKSVRLLSNFTKNINKMKRLIVIVCGAGLLYASSSCGVKNESGEEIAATDTVSSIPTADNSRNSLHWEGVYEGVIPCADCEGIQVQMVLNNDLTYQQTYLYLGKNETEPLVNSGSFHWKEDGNTIVLGNISREEFPCYYKVGENKLIQLDLNGDVISGGLADKYILAKVK
jgi:uncharacterized lipoprotein NlpE involved in copper resistance